VQGRPVGLPAPFTVSVAAPASPLEEPEAEEQGVNELAAGWVAIDDAESDTSANRGADGRFPTREHGAQLGSLVATTVRATAPAKPFAGAASAHASEAEGRFTGASSSSEAGCVSSTVLSSTLTELGVPCDLAVAISVSSSSVRSALLAALECDDLNFRVVQVPDAANPADVVARVPLGSATAPSESPPATGVGVVGPSESAPSWNAFQQRLAGTGLGRSQVARLYHEEQQALRARAARLQPPPAGVDHGGDAQSLRIQSNRSAAVAALPSVVALAPSSPQRDHGHSTDAAANVVPLELGYLAVRLPHQLEHLRGHHRCSWRALLARLGLTHAAWTSAKAQFYMPKFVNQSMANDIWGAQGLRLPIPIDPGVGVGAGSR